MTKPCRLSAAAAIVCLAGLNAKGPNAQTAEPSYEVISIKINKNPQSPRSSRVLPDGGIAMTRVPVTQLVSQAFTDPNFRGDMVGLPKWAFSTNVDIIATVAPGRGPATAEQRRNMMRALLVSRFQLAWHEEVREVEVYDLVHNRADRRLGPGLTKSTSDCEAAAAQRRADVQAAIAAGKVPPPPVIVPPSGPLPPCTLRQGNNRYEGEIPIDALPPILRGFTTRTVIDKTGLTGSYRLTFEAVPAIAGTTDADTQPGNVPSVFTAVQEQLGLKLVAARGKFPAIVIDRLELPSEN